MHDTNRLMKWLLVLGLVVMALVSLWPPHEKLKGGIDLVGGSSLLFEIDTTGLDKAQQRGLSTRVMNILRERVDPHGQLNLGWRPVGNTRLEIRMPRPPREVVQRREAYNEALARLKGLNLSRFELESALNLPADERSSVLDGLARGVLKREPLLDAAVETFDKYQEAQAASDPTVSEEASKDYEEAVAQVLNTCLPISRFTDVLALTQGEAREKELGKLRAAYPSYDSGAVVGGDSKLISEAVRFYDLWAANKSDLEDPADLKRRIRGAGVLEFRILADRDATSPVNTGGTYVEPISKYTEQLAKSGPRHKGGAYRWFPIEDVLRFAHVDDLEEFEAIQPLAGRPIYEEYAGRYYVLVHSGPEYGLLRRSGKKPWKLQRAMVDRDPATGENVVSFALDNRGGNLFGELTGNNKQRQLCIMLDDTAMSHATIIDRITNRCQISGDFTVERVQELVRTLEAGSLPARLKETPLSETTIGPSLGETNRRKGISATVYGGIAVAVFMVVYYGITAGGMAVVALVLNLLFVLAGMALLQATFTLPGIAALILTVGMAVDANVLIFERIREEVDRGIIFKKALNAGYAKAFSTIFDANLTTLIICVVLGFVGSEEVKGFAIVLGIGITTSMFTALFVTKLAFNSLIAVGWLKGFSMRRIIGQPSIDWIGLRKKFWPVSLVAVVVGMTLFVGTSIADKEAVFDIEFLGGTSVQIDLKPEFPLDDEEMTDFIASSEGDSAAAWLAGAADDLERATAADGEVPGRFVLESSELTAGQLAALMRRTVEDRVERGGIRAVGGQAVFDAKAGALNLAGFKIAVSEAADAARRAGNRLRNARVQSVSEVGDESAGGKSYEISTVETNSALVQEAIMAVLGDKLEVQRAIGFSTAVDDMLTRDHFFVVESEDKYLSDVIAGDATFDIRKYRGGTGILVSIDEREEPLVVADFERRLREIGLQVQFEQYSTRDSKVFPLGKPSKRADGETGYRRFAVLSVDELLLYEDDAVQWTESLARPLLEQVEAALGSEKSLSKVISFLPQIAQQTKNSAIFAIVVAFAAIVAYLWLRFGTKEYGLAAIVALVHDVTVTLGLVALSHYVYASVFGKALLLTDFKIDLSMVAAILTVIGYSLNDTIVVFDRIRENRGRIGSLNSSLINNSLNQTLSRTVLTSTTTFLVVFILYVWGGKGVHGFSFALLIGVVVGTYSSLGVATPLLYRPRLLRAVVLVIAALGLIGIVLVEVEGQTARLIWCGAIAASCAGFLARGKMFGRRLADGAPATA